MICKSLPTVDLQYRSCGSLNKQLHPNVPETQANITVSERNHDLKTTKVIKGYHTSEHYVTIKRRRVGG